MIDTCPQSAISSAAPMAHGWFGLPSVARAVTGFHPGGRSSGTSPAIALAGIPLGRACNAASGRLPSPGRPGRGAVGRTGGTARWRRGGPARRQRAWRVHTEELLARPFMDNIYPDDVESVEAVLAKHCCA